MKHPDQYFIMLSGNHYVAKNKLQREWKDYCKKHDRKLITGIDGLNAFVQEMRSQAKFLSNKYPNCHPLQWMDYKYEHFDDCDRQFGILNVCCFTAYKVQHNGQQAA
jgi:hypothetical protein